MKFITTILDCFFPCALRREHSALASCLVDVMTVLLVCANHVGPADDARRHRKWEEATSPVKPAYQGGSGAAFVKLGSVWSDTRECGLATISD